MHNRQSSWSSPEYRAKYRLSYPRGQRPGAAARQSPAGTRVSSPPSALRIARAVVQALTTARAARAPWDRCVAAVSAATPRTGCPPPARRRASRGTRRAAPSREPRKAGSGIGVRGCAAAHTQSVTHTGFVYILYPYIVRVRPQVSLAESGGVFQCTTRVRRNTTSATTNTKFRRYRSAGERWSVLRACGVTRHRLRRILEVPEYQHIGQST